MASSTARALPFARSACSWPVRVVAVAHDPGDLPRRPLTIEERVKCHLAIEQVFWRHRTWPAENRSPKPRLKDILPADRMRQQAVDALAKSSALGELGRDPVTPARLQAEMDRIARSTRDPKMLAELFAALENDPYLIAECLVRPLVADAGLRNWYQGSSSTLAHGESSVERAAFSTESEEPSAADGEDGGESPSRARCDDGAETEAVRRLVGGCGRTIQVFR